MKLIYVKIHTAVLFLQRPISKVCPVTRKNSKKGREWVQRHEYIWTDSEERDLVANNPDRIVLLWGTEKTLSEMRGCPKVAGKNCSGGRRTQITYSESSEGSHYWLGISSVSSRKALASTNFHGWWTVASSVKHLQ